MRELRPDLEIPGAVVVRFRRRGYAQRQHDLTARQRAVLQVLHESQTGLALREILCSLLSFALAITLIGYGVTELVGAYGFIGVFVTAYVVRDTERQNHVHDHLPRRHGDRAGGRHTPGRRPCAPAARSPAPVRRDLAARSAGPPKPEAPNLPLVAGSPGDAPGGCGKRRTPGVTGVGQLAENRCHPRSGV
jgi:hypothetical protein